MADKAPPPRKLVFCFDIDGTLCSNTEGAYEEARPKVRVIRQVNRLHEQGHTILLYTARGSTTGIDWRALTEQQLRSWGVRYHQLTMGKPTADVYIDDKARNAFDWIRQGFPSEFDLGGPKHGTTRTRGVRQRNVRPRG